MPARTIAVLFLAGSCVVGYAATRHAGHAEPTSQMTHTEQDPEAQAVTDWLYSLPLPGFASEFPEPGLTKYQSRALGALKAEPEFEQFLAEVPNTGRLYFGRYLAWQIRNLEGDKAADKVLFVHTIMNDLARLKTFSEERIIEIRLERERQYGSLLQPVRARFEQELQAHNLPQSTIDTVMETFVRSAADTRNYLTNPACAYCDLPAPPEIVQRMRRYQEESVSRVADRINEAMNRPNPSSVWQIPRLKFVAMQIEQMVAQDFSSRMAYRDQPEIQSPGSPGERTLQPGPYSIFFPTEWDRFSYWRATGGRGWTGGSSSGGVNDPEPTRYIVLRYRPDEDYPDRDRYESVHDQPVED